MTPPHMIRRSAWGAAMALALAACAEPVAEVRPTADETVYTAAGRFPAAKSGILIAQSAALAQGRALCDGQGRRFRPLGSIAGEDPTTGEALYAVRFRCLATQPALAPLPGSPPQANPPGGKSL